MEIFMIIYRKLHSATNKERSSIMVDSEKLKKRIAEMGILQADVAKKLNCSQSTVSLKINNKRPFFLDEAWELARMLRIEDQFFSYFFASEVA